VVELQHFLSADCRNVIIPLVTRDSGLGQGTLGKNHFFDFIVQIQKFCDAFSSAIPSAMALLASFAS